MIIEPTGYGYGDREPVFNCPYCGTLTHADFCDVGVGFVQVGPYHCEHCKASQIGSNDKEVDLSDEEREKGWYSPGRKPGSSANVDANGNIIPHWLADNLYREQQGVKPRYTETGQPIKRKL